MPDMCLEPDLVAYRHSIQDETSPKRKLTLSLEIGIRLRDPLALSSLRFVFGDCFLNVHLENDQERSA